MDRVAVVTGGAGGIGRCLVETLVSVGYRVYFIDRDEAAIQQLAAQGCVAKSYLGDIANEKVVRSFACFVLSQESHIDLLVNNACVTRGGILSGCSYEDFLYVQQVAVAAPYLLVQLFKEHLRPIASIINLSSTRAFQSQADTESYTAAKGGITALTHALSVSLAGVATVNAIAPGWIDTSAYHNGVEPTTFDNGDLLQHPSQRVGMPQDIAQAVLFLSDEKNRFINGQTLVIDGGMSRLMTYHNDQGWSFQP